MQEDIETEPASPTFPEPLILACARAAHEVNRAFCQHQDDYSQAPWSEAEEWQRQSVIAGVRAILIENINPAESHARWLARKREEGWVYGTLKDPEAKRHPCLVDYHMLPPEQRVKDALFGLVVRATAVRLSGYQTPTVEFSWP